MQNEQLERQFIFYLCERFDLRPSEVVETLNKALAELSAKAQPMAQPIEQETVEPIEE